MDGHQSLKEGNPVDEKQAAATVRIIQLVLEYGPQAAMKIIAQFQGAYPAGKDPSLEDILAMESPKAPESYF